jgi:hypothetical protein
MISIFSIFLTIFSALLLYGLFPLQKEKSWHSALLQFIISTGLILAINSVALFLWMLLLGSVNQNFIFFEIITTALLLIAYINKKDNWKINLKKISFQGFKPKSFDDWLYLTLFFIFLLFLFISILGFFRNSIGGPHGQWDAWAIWNLRARFLAMSGAAWQEIFANTAWSHTDYPLLLPNTIARYWIYAKNQSVLVPIFVAFFFAIGSVLAVFSSASTFINKKVGILSAIVLLATPFFSFSASQYADVPLAFFILMSLILVTFYFKDKTNYSIILLAIYASLAAWTKNEGLLFLVVFFGLFFIFNMFSEKNRKKNFKNIILFIFGAALVTSSILFMKFKLAPVSDLTPTKTETTIKKLTTISRYKTIQKGLEKNSKSTIPITITLLLLLSFLKTKKLNIFKKVIGTLAIAYGGYHPYLLPLIALVLLLAKFFPKTKYSKAAIFSFAAINLILLGYFLIYLITPNDLKWHINTSMNRLFIQLIPAIIFTIALTFSDKERD